MSTCFFFRFQENKAENECPACPGDDGGHSGDKTLICPYAPNQNDHVPKRHLCWNENHCQKSMLVSNGGNEIKINQSSNMNLVMYVTGCPDKCHICNEERVCCDYNCLGGCPGTSSNCTVCRGYSIGDYGDRQCVQECPAELFKVIINLLLKC